MKSNVILIGFMGSGKTSVGKRLAHELNKQFIDFDEEIQKETGLSIPQIFETKGESFFRMKEQKIAEKIANHSNLVIATGGGIVLNHQNIKNLSLNGFIIYLKCEFDLIVQRIKAENTRPLYSKNDLEIFKEIFNSRTILYESSAEIIISVENKSYALIIEEIKEKMKNWS